MAAQHLVDGLLQEQKVVLDLDQQRWKDGLESGDGAAPVRE